MAAEHGLIVKHTISVLLLVAWCGITYIGTGDRAITHDLKHHDIDMLGLPVCGMGCTIQHHNHKNWQKINCREIAAKDCALVFLAQTKNVDDAKNMQVHPANKSVNLQFDCSKNEKPKHCMPADSRLKRDEDDGDDSNYHGCGTSHSTGQGNDDHDCRSLPHSHWIGSNGFWKVWEACFHVKAFYEPNCSIAVTSHKIINNFGEAIGDNAEKLRYGP